MDRTISATTYNEWHNQPILHDEDEWDGKYKTYGEMWLGEGYTIKDVDMGMVLEVLTKYDNLLKDKAEHYAEMMMVGIEDGDEELAMRNADKYHVNTIERQRVHNVMKMIKE